MLDRFTKNDVVLAEPLPGTAVVRSRQRRSIAADESDRDAPSAKYQLDLEVSVDGRDPYSVSGKVKVPNRYFDITPGVSLPVKIEAKKPERIVVDWDAFDAAGGKQIVAEAADRWRRDQPKRQKEAVEAHKAQAAAQFIDQLDKLVASGRMTPEQAESQKRAMELDAAGELDDSPPIGASPLEELEWQRKKGLLDQATFDAIIANNPNLK